MSDGIPHLAERLDLLFRTVPRSPGSDQLHTNESVVKALGQMGIKVTAAHVANLRNGRRDNPSAVLLDGLARTFAVPIDYFFDREVADGVREGLGQIDEERSHAVQKVLLRAQAVSPESIDALMGVLTELRRIEGIAPSPPSPGTSLG